MAEADEEDIVCNRCDARTAYVDDDGYEYCENGHRLDLGPAVGDDDDDYFQRGRKVTKQREKGLVKKAQKVFHGQQALRLYIQAYQYILWQQCHTLIHVKILPHELWTVVRDLWTLRLGKLAPRLESHDEGVASVLAEEGSSNPKVASNLSEASTEQAMANAMEPKKRRKQALSHLPRLVESISLCYLGVLLLRLDVSLGDIYRWILAGDIIYTRAINAVPREMRQKLPGEYREALDPPVLLKRNDLHRAVNHLVSLYSVEFAMSFPPLNSSLLLFKYLRRLALPVEIYSATQKLRKLINDSFSYASTVNRRHQENKPYPEIRLLALMIISVKLFYPFDDSRQYPRSLTEPAAQNVQWPRWIEMHQTFEKGLREEVHSGHARNFGINENDALSMTGPEVDRYMDWYQRTWTKTDLEAEGAHREILNLFPLPRLSPEPQRGDTEQAFESRVTAKLIQAHVFLVNNEAVSDGETEDHEGGTSRPAALYKAWRAEEDLPPFAKAFIRIAADTIGVSMDALLLGVMQTERAIAKLKERERRRNVFPDEDDENAQDAVEGTVDELARMSIDGEVGDASMAIDL